MAYKLLPNLLFLLIIFLPALAKSADLPNASSEFVGSAACAQCHQQEYKHWKKSHHNQAMQLASDKTVLGDFNHARFNYLGDVTTFYKKNGQYFIKTRNPNGKKRMRIANNPRSDIVNSIFIVCCAL